MKIANYFSKKMILSFKNSISNPFRLSMQNVGFIFFVLNQENLHLPVTFVPDPNR